MEIYPFLPELQFPTKKFFFFLQYQNNYVFDRDEQIKTGKKFAEENKNKLQIGI